MIARLLDECGRSLDVTMPRDVRLDPLRELLSDDKIYIICEGWPYFAPDAQLFLAIALLRKCPTSAGLRSHHGRNTDGRRRKGGLFLPHLQ